MRWICAAAVMLAMGTVAWADEVTDALEKALALYKQGNFIAAQQALEQARKLLEPKAMAQIPPATVKGLTYFNYEHGFRISAPGKDWHIQPLVVKTTTPDAITTMVTMSYGPVEEGEIAIYYVRNLRQAMGGQFETVAKNEKAALQAWARNATSLVGNLTDCTKATVTEFKVGERPAVRSEFTGKREGKPMHCWVVQVLAGEKLFTGIFLSTEANWALRSRDFENMIGTMSTDVPMPEPVLQPTEKTK